MIPSREDNMLGRWSKWWHDVLPLVFFAGSVGKEMIVSFRHKHCICQLPYPPADGRDRGIASVHMINAFIFFV